MNKTINNYINQLKLDPKKEAAVRKLIESVEVSDSTPVVNSLDGDELILVKQNDENKAVAVETIKNEVLKLPSKFEFVDLGLPSGTKWATCNIGANSPEEAGLYFAWGETEGYTAEDVANGVKAFTDSTYKWYDGIWYKRLKYNNDPDYGVVDNLLKLELEDDAAYQIDKSCRYPTIDEFTELLENTTQEYITYNGINCIKFIGSNNNYIILPAGGAAEERIHDTDMFMYRSSNLETDNNVFGIYGKEIYLSKLSRKAGMPIRPVQDASTPSTLVEKVNAIEEKINTTKGIFIITTDMFEPISTIAERPTLTFTDDGYNNLINAVNNHNIIALDIDVYSYLRGWAGSTYEAIENPFVKGYHIITCNIRGQGYFVDVDVDDNEEKICYFMIDFVNPTINIIKCL